MMRQTELVERVQDDLGQLRTDVGTLRRVAVEMLPREKPENS